MAGTRTELQMIKMSEIQSQEVAWLWFPFIPYGKLTIVQGDPGDGKTTLVLNIGNGYKLTYGGLKELQAKEGDVLESGAVIGYVSEPTKYYSTEGSNVYFAMTKDGEPVDPVLYLE